MNTPNTVLSREQLKQFRNIFRKLANSRNISTSDIVLYNLARGLPANRGFTQVTNTTKLANGTNAWQSFESAKSTIKWIVNRHPDRLQKKFEDSLTREQLSQLVSSL